MPIIANMEKNLDLLLDISRMIFFLSELFLNFVFMTVASVTKENLSNYG